MDQLQAIRIFSVIAETGSFSIAARSLGITQPTASKQMMALERYLGAKLIDRTGRTIKLTDLGCEYHQTAVKAVTDLAEADNRLRNRFAAAVGSLRLVAPSVFSRAQIMSLISAFLSKYPDLSIEFSVDEQSPTPADVGFDLAITIGQMADSPHIARRICTTRLATVASTGYLERRGVPRSIEELAEHECIAHAASSAPADWAFAGPDGPMTIPPQGRLRVSNSQNLRHAVLAGIGLAQPVALLFGPELKQGVVKSVLEEYEPAPVPVYIVYPKSLRGSGKINRFADFLARELPHSLAH